MVSLERTSLAALHRWLNEAFDVFNSRFKQARDRGHASFIETTERQWDGEYDFVQLADPQLGMFHMDKAWDEELTMLRLAVLHVNRLHKTSPIRFLLVSGDLTNAWPTSEEGLDKMAAQAASFKEALRELNPEIAIVLQPGNHDIGQNPTSADVDRYVDRFGDDYFSFWAGGVFYISINSQYYHILCDNNEAASLRAQQEQWLEQEFEKAESCSCKHVVLLSHISPFMGDEHEPQGHFNWERKPRQRVLELATKAGVKLWLCGHYHGNCEVVAESGIEVVTSASCGGVINWSKRPSEIAPSKHFNFLECVSDPAVVVDSFHSGIRAVRVRANVIEHQWLELAAIPKTLDEVFPQQSPRDRRISRSIARPSIRDMLDVREPAAERARSKGWGRKNRAEKDDGQAKPSLDKATSAPALSQRPELKRRSASLLHDPGMHPFQRV